jgi:hypothetical protein
MRESEGQENMTLTSRPLASRNYFFFAGFFGAAFTGAAFTGVAFFAAAFAGAAFFGAGFFGAACAIIPSFWSWVSISSSLLYFLLFHIKKILSLLDNR